LICRDKRDAFKGKRYQYDISRVSFMNRGGPASIILSASLWDNIKPANTKDFQIEDDGRLQWQKKIANA